LLAPGSEWRLHRHWFGHSAMADLLGVDERVAQDDTLYRGLDRYGAAERIWVMDRGIPAEVVLEELRQADSRVKYLVGTPKGRLTKFESQLAERTWQQVRPRLRVKQLPQ
jgi:DNA-binding transcriptional regulator YdaS (Cro superfamily)